MHLPGYGYDDKEEKHLHLIVQNDFLFQVLDPQEGKMGMRGISCSAVGSVVKHKFRLT